MALKTFNPTTPGQRQLVLVDRSAHLQGQAGQNADRGQALERRPWQHGSHHRALPRWWPQEGLPRRRLQAHQGRCSAKVERLEYDPNRSAFIALIKYADGEQAYILAPQRLAVGDTVIAGSYVDVKPGNVMPLGNMPVGTIVHNVELKIGKGGQIARSAGTYAQIVGRDHDFVIVRLNSGEQRPGSRPLRRHHRCGVEPGPHEHLDRQGRSYPWMGWRPHNRGVVMNPVDHPHGGGEGRTSGGRHPVTPWGKPTKGKKTRSNKSTNKFILISRHKRKK